MANPEALRYSQEEWASIIEDAYQSLPSDFPKYDVPSSGSLEFAKLIDHTLLKLDATPAQVDKLCEEAKEYKFKVRRISPFSHAETLQNIQSTTLAWKTLYLLVQESPPSFPVPSSCLACTM